VEHETLHVIIFPEVTLVSISNASWILVHTFKTLILFCLRCDRLCCLVIRVPGYGSRDSVFDSWRYQIFWEVVDLERGPPSLVSITEELLEWKSNGSGSRKPRLTVWGIRYADHATLSIRKKLVLTSSTCSGRSVGIIRLRTKVMAFSLDTHIYI
jgi:hypothetical protein